MTPAHPFPPYDGANYDFSSSIGHRLVQVMTLMRREVELRMVEHGLTDAQYETVVKADPEARKWGWRRMVRDPEVYVKGRVVHPDHKTVVLDPWHRVFPNTETQARSMRNVAFLDLAAALHPASA